VIDFHRFFDFTQDGDRMARHLLERVSMAIPFQQEGPNLEGGEGETDVTDH